MDANAFAQLVTGVKHRGDRYAARCPAHEDARASLSFSDGEKGVLVKCFAGCALDAIAAALGIRTTELFHDYNGNGGAPRARGDLGPIVVAYDYRDEAGRVLFQVTRHDPKDFRQRRPDGRGGWVWGLEGVRRILYHLPELPKDADPVLVCEGEKDVDVLRRLGFTATTNPGGAGKWRAEYAASLTGRQVVLLPHNDDPGRKHMDAVAQSLQGVAASIQWLAFEDVVEKGDVADWLAQGHSADELRALITKAPTWEEVQAGARDEGEAAAEMPTIDAGDLDLARVTTLVWDALLAANSPPSLFRYGGLLARIETGDDGSPMVRPLTLDRLRYTLARVAAWETRRKHRGKLLVKPAMPPIPVVRDLLARPDAPLPVLTRLVEAPIFAADGSLHATPGYHVASRTLYVPAPGFTVPPVPTIPTPRDIMQARDLLIGDLLGDFPFVSDSERCHAVALLLAPFLREMIEGPTPFHLIEKPSPGTGATLLADVVMLPATGRPLASMTEGRDEDEWRKRITAKLMTGPVAVLIDNLRRRLDSPALSSVLTATVWEDRFLGKTETLRLPNRSAWLGTGNNPALSSEIARRTIRIRLDARTDRPWLREGFRHPDLRGWALTHRGELVWAALTIGRAWLAAGRPAGAVGFGMFEEWSRMMGGILAVAGLPGFLGNLEAFYQASDVEGAAWRAFVAAWWDRHGETAVGVRDLWAVVAPSDGDPIDLGLGDGNERSQKIKLGKRLAEARDRQWGGYRVVDGGTSHRAQGWRLAPVGEGREG